MYRFILSIFALLMFILSIDGTITLRYLLIVTLFLSLFFSTKKNNEGLLILFDSKDFKLAIGFLGLFILYVFIHSVFISLEPDWSLSEFKSHIIYPSIYFFTGLLLANYINRSKKISKESFITVLFYSLFVHIIYLDFAAIDYLFHEGVMLRRYGGLMDSPVLPNYLTNILLAMIIAEFVYRLRTKKQVLKVSDSILYLFLAACIFSTFVEALRLGDIALVFLGIGSCMAFLYKNNDYSNKMKSFIGAALIFILTVPLMYNIATDPRWAKLIETVPVAVSSSEDSSFIDPAAPVLKTESGYEVTGSNYTRIVYAIKSFKYIIEDPMGVGFGRNAFGHALELRHPEYAKRGMHAHSAILELSIGAGIIATMIWLSFVFVISKSAVIEFRRTLNYYAMLTLFLTMGFVGRGFVDANMRDHMFLQFMLMLGICIYFMIIEQSKTIE
mgnify:CR=1 FL=1